MASLKFQDVIGFYRANNDAVYKDLKTAYLVGRLTPFVGAGLSVFCGYKLWPSVLKELSAFIPDEGPKQEAMEMIERFEYLEAAEHIQKHYRPMLRRLLQIVSYDKLEACPDEHLYSSAAWTLPYLFHDRPLMTTNFDGVLEYVFSKQGSTFERVVEPHDPTLLTQIRQRDIHGLFKLHGDIGKETASLDRLVFTKTQYDDVYCTGGELIHELKQWYQNQTLLFLGCSLAMDKTMEVLRDVASDNPGIRHFAIVGCKKEQRSELLDRFSELGIDAIFYDDSNHDAVRVILENLLYETNPDAYQQLDDEMRRFVGPVKRDDVLMYNAGRIKYVGRTAELTALERFCSSQVNNEWWAVTGPGGIGKSRLIYEFTNKKQKEGWQILWFSREQHYRLTDLQLPAENTIVVLDDVQADTQTAGEWLKAMRTHRRANRLRILLIEREGADYGSADWLRVLRSGNPYSDPLAQWCHHKTFLHLEPLTADDLKAIMESCAEALGKSIDSAALLTALGRVDGGLRRPLYALAIAEAACGGKAPLHWDPERVLDEMLDRELAFHYESLRYVLKQDPTLTQQQELELLMAQCCIYGQLSADTVTKETYPHLTDCMAGRSPAEFFRCLGLLHAEEGPSVLRMNCPDLIKEHLVLRLAFEQETLELLPDGWYEESERFFFLDRLWRNHPDRLMDEAAFWDRFFSASPASGLSAWLYADLLWGCTDVFPPHAQRAVDALDILYRANSKDEEITKCYAKGLVNLSYDQPLEDCATTVERLKELYDAHSENAEVAVAYTKGLYNLSISQSPEDLTATVDQLEALYNKHSSNQEIAQYYAGSLVNLAFSQTKEADVRHMLARSRAVLDQHSDNPDIQLSHAQTWFNLTLVQSESDIPATVSEITAFLQSHPDAIPEFREALDEHLAEHPDHAVRYQPLLELGGDGHA